MPLIWFDELTMSGWKDVVSASLLQAGASPALQRVMSQVDIVDRMKGPNPHQGMGLT